jgi:hypothetical protein
MSLRPKIRTGHFNISSREYQNGSIYLLRLNEKGFKNLLSHFAKIYTSLLRKIFLNINL